jgi:hypothetical protein
LAVSATRSRDGPGWTQTAVAIQPCGRVIGLCTAGASPAPVGSHARRSRRTGAPHRGTTAGQAGSGAWQCSRGMTDRGTRGAAAAQRLPPQTGTRARRGRCERWPDTRGGPSGLQRRPHPCGAPREPWAAGRARWAGARPSAPAARPGRAGRRLAPGHAAARSGGPRVCGARLGRWRGARPAPLPRIALPPPHGTQRPRSLPTLADRARPAVARQALPPKAETTGDQHASGCRPTRRGADALAPCGQILRQQTAATWRVAGESHGVCERRRVAGRAAHLPRHTGVWSPGRRRGVIERSPRLAPTAAVPPGGMRSPVVSPMGWEGRDAVVHGGSWPRRVHPSPDGRWADAGIVPAPSRPV